MRFIFFIFIVFFKASKLTLVGKKFEIEVNNIQTHDPIQWAFFKGSILTLLSRKLEIKVIVIQTRDPL